MSDIEGGHILEKISPRKMGLGFGMMMLKRAGEEK